MSRALEIAERIGLRLVAQAEWTGGLCRWEIRRLDRSRAGGHRRSIGEPCGGTLYQGSAGIALFLAELYHQTGEARFARTARGAMAHALSACEDLPPASFGFYGGRVGIAWTAARLAERLEQPELLAAAHGLLEPLRGLEHLDTGLDTIAGAAGAIPALLDLESRVDPQLCRAMATALGERLLAAALREPVGWSWPTGGPSAVRHLTGLAHGTAGIALALLELATATGDGRCQFGAEMAFLYERSFFDPRASNWPDLRHSQIGDRLVFDQLTELRGEARAGRVAPYEKKFMVAWCHGSPGIALSRVRAFELTGQALYAEEALAALRSTHADLEATSRDGRVPGACLCHGALGNCEVLLEGAERLETPGSKDLATGLAARIGAHYELEGRPWPCGTPNGETDPSLLVGEAGIGYFYLRLADARLPSVLLLRPRVNRSAPRPDTFLSAAHDEVGYWLGDTRQALEQLGDKSPPVPALDSANPLRISPAAAAMDWFHQHLAGVEPDRRSRLEDASRVERIRYQQSLELVDFTRGFLHSLVRPESQDICWNSARLELAPGVSRIDSSWNGRTWQGDGLDAQHRCKSVPWLIHRSGRRIRQRQVGPLVAALLDLLESPRTLAELIESFGSREHPSPLAGSRPYSSSDGAAAPLAETVRAQLEQLYRAGILDLVESPGTGSCRTGSRP